MEFRLLGPVEAGRAGETVPLSGRLQRSLLCALLLHSNRAVSLGVLAESLWGAARPVQTREALVGQVARLRRSLAGWESDGGGRLELRPPGYLLRVEPDELDVTGFDRLRVAAGRTVEPLAAAIVLRRALRMWRGPLFDDVTPSPTTAAAARRLESARQQSYVALVELDLRLGRAADIVPDLEELVSRYPLHETFYEQLMRALWYSGRTMEAVDVYHRARRVMIEELGAEPSGVLRKRLHSMLAAL